MLPELGAPVTFSPDASIIQCLYLLTTIYELIQWKELDETILLCTVIPVFLQGTYLIFKIIILK